MEPAPNTLTEADYRAAAKRLKEREGELEIDPGAKVSRAEGDDEQGAYVQAWVWVDREQVKPGEGSARA